MNNSVPNRWKRKLLYDRQGLTLVEIVTVLVIISLLALFAAPEVINWRPRMRLKDAAEELYSNLQRAKVHALKNNVAMELKFTAPATCPGGSYAFDDGIAPPTPPDVDISGVFDADTGVCLVTGSLNFDPNESFNSRGIPAKGGGDLTIKSTDSGVDHTYKIVLSPAGGLSIEKENL